MLFSILFEMFLKTLEGDRVKAIKFCVM